MRQPNRRTIITCAVTGNLTTPDQTPHLPVTPGEIAESALGAADAAPPGVVHVPVWTAPPFGGVNRTSNVHSSAPARNAGVPPAAVAVTGRRRNR